MKELIFISQKGAKGSAEAADLERRRKERSALIIKKHDQLLQRIEQRQVE